MFAAASADSVPAVALSTTHSTGQTFEQVVEQIRVRSELSLPDKIIPISRLRATDDDFIDVPDVGLVRMTIWSRRQLAALLGIRWDRWFSDEVVAPAVVLVEINLRFRRSSEIVEDPNPPLGRRGRAARGGCSAPSSRQRTPPLMTFASLRRWKTAFGAVLQLRFVRLDITAESSQYAVVSLEEVDLGIAKPDRHRNGFLIANSETGSRSLTLLVWIWRLVCTNGLVAPDVRSFG